MNKETVTAFPINELAKNRWSPRAFEDKPVAMEKLISLLEAARWSPSGGNEQPWRFMVGQGQNETWEKIYATLADGNKEWNGNVPVLIMAIGYKISSWDGGTSDYFQYDTGQAVAHLTIEAMNQGLHCHQMGGFSAEKARELFDVPDDYLPLTVIAVGYIGNPESLSDKLKKREIQERSRKQLNEIVFSRKFGEPASFINGKLI